MKYLEYRQEAIENYGERLELVMGRIAEIAAEPVTEVLSAAELSFEESSSAGYTETENSRMQAPFGAYFKEVASYQLLQYEVWQKALNGQLEQMDAAEAAAWNAALYEPFQGAAYERSFACHTFATEQLGMEAGQILASVYASIVNNNVQIHKGTPLNLCIYAELFVELYGYFSQPQWLSMKDVKECVRSFMHDYAELFMENRVASMLDPDFSPEREMIQKADLQDPAYLYRFGYYVGTDELASQRFLASLPEAQIQAMADTYTEGYRIGFTVMNKDISRKKVVQLYYPLGFERMIGAAIANYEKMGFGCTLSPFSSSVNKQMDYDHREDSALWTDKEITEYRIECQRKAFEKYKETAPLYGGPDAIDVFGEEPFEPQERPANPAFDENQRKLSRYFRSSISQMTNKYVHGEERSYSMIAYPAASIGPDYEEIFAETVKLNTLDYVIYRDIQQRIIDLLDTADRVHITGTAGNRTDLTVNLWKLKNPAEETIFENCVADVNIPLGEVFTSPVLEGTNGRLHVSQVYLEGYLFKNLELEFKDGMITSYSCSNFDSEDQNRKYIEDNILFHHPTLPMGEFAIGTNTVAYCMGIRYQIQDKLPILIAEKTGPHFAVGDTCYSYEEDCMNYNPDGKKVVARENSRSALRKTAPDQAYFNCHTDITIPYQEIGAITAIRKDGSSADIIRNGRFVVPGSELLNEPLDQLEAEGR